MILRDLWDWINLSQFDPIIRMILLIMTALTVHKSGVLSNQSAKFYATTGNVARLNRVARLKYEKNFRIMNDSSFVDLIW